MLALSSETMSIELTVYSSPQAASSIFQDCSPLSPSRWQIFLCDSFLQGGKVLFFYMYYTFTCNILLLCCIIIWCWQYTTTTNILDPWHFAVLGEIVVKSGEVRAFFLEISTGECSGEGLGLRAENLCPLCYSRDYSPLNRHSYLF